MRVVSLVPAATEMVFALGAIDELVAVTHDDDFPSTVRSLPRVTESTIPAEATAREIDRRVRAAADHGDSTFHLDEAALRDARPDVILGQTLCAVCAVTLDRIPETLEHAPAVVPLDASSIEGMFSDLVRVGAALGRERVAGALLDSLRKRLREAAVRTAGRPRPRVACLEWLDPPFNAGHWVPEQVRLAGGVDVLGREGERSREVSWSEVQAGRAALVIAMPCGWDAERAAREAVTLPDLGDARVFAVDGAAYFSRPGPRLVDGVELLASVMHPELVAPPPGAIAIEVRSGRLVV
jgi:iron complex transport system substrate-binding protein